MQNLIIVYISLAIFAGALIYLGISAFKIYKDSKPAIQNLTETAARLQKQTENIKIQTTELTAHQKEIQQDIQAKKEKVNHVVVQAKQTPKLFKKLWTKRIPYVNKFN